jgi:adenosylcobinamide-phosphate synthase
MTPLTATASRPARGVTWASPPRPLAAALGVMADGVLGEPPAQLHPVGLFGSCMEHVEWVAYRDHRLAGVAHAAFGAALGIVGGAILGSTAVATYVSVAGRELRAVATSIGDALEASDLDRARALLPSLVGRDVARLDAGEMSRAVVESVAENTVDAVVAPAWWAVVAGPPGVLAHRAVNTMDAMVGHRSDRYLRFGWASARLDDAAAFIPARVTAALVALVRPGAARQIWRAVRLQAPSHPSPNAGVAEAAFAAALDVCLGGQNRYGDTSEHRPVLGTGRDAEPGDIRRAVALSQDVSTALAMALGTAGVLVMVKRGAPRVTRGRR